MESKDKVEIAIKQLMEAKKLTNELRPGENESFVPVDDDYNRLLANLISQVMTTPATFKFFFFFFLFIHLLLLLLN